MLAIQLAGRVVHELNAGPGDPSLQEILEALPPDSPSLLRVDLRSAARAPRHPATRRVTTPPDWRARQPFLSVFVDGERIGFSPRRPAGSERNTNGAFYVPVSGRAAELAVTCSSGPCRNAVAVVEGPALRRAIARVRAPAHPGILAAAATVWLVGVALLGAARAHWTGRTWAAAVAAGAAALALWVRADLAAVPRIGDPLLAYQLVLVGLGVAAARWGLERWGPILTTAAAGTLVVPLVLSDRSYLTDWANHLYYVARQADTLRELWRPGYFLHSHVTGAFYPYYAFYGGTAYAATALLAVVAGSSLFAYRASYVVALLSAYGGTVWLGRQAGLTSWRAHLPGLVLVSSAYYLTNAYGRGTWGEFLATSALPPLIAAAVSRLRGVRPKASGAALLAAAAAFSGSHTVTLVWGGLFLALLGAVGLAAVLGGPRSDLARPARLLDVLLLAAAGVAANAWFLGPLAAFGRSTDIARHAGTAFGTHGLALADAATWLHPLRYTPAGSGAPDLYVQLPVYALAWAAAACASGFRQLEVPWRRLCAGLALLFLLFLWLTTSDRSDAVWRWAPETLKAVQFQFRLHSYVNLAAAGLVLIGQLAAQRSHGAGRWQAALVAAVAVQLALAQYQVWSARRFAPVEPIATAGARAPRTLQAPQDYRFTGPARDGERVLEAERQLQLDPSHVRGERARLEIPEEWGETLAVLNVPHSPFLRVSGDGQLAGRTRAGWAVVALEARGGPPRRIELAGSPPWPARAGTVVSGTALVLGALLILCGRGSARGRQ